MQAAKPKNDWKKGFWPDIKTEEGTKQAIAAGYWSSYIIAGITAILIPFGVTSAASLVDVTIMAVAGLCIQFYKSRTAAVIAFILFVLGKTQMIVEGRVGGVGVVAVILALGLLNGIRGTFAYHKAKKK